MSINDLFHMAVRNLWKRKLRTFLTVLGVIIGTTSIVVMVSIGIGMNEGFKQQVEQWGSLQIINVSSSGGGGQSYGMVYIDSGKSGGGGQKKDAELNLNAIADFKQIPGVVAATPMIQDYIRVACGKYVSEGQLIGIDPDSMVDMGYKLDKGRVLEDGDKKVIVFGSQVATNFYDPKLNWQMRYSTPPPEVDVMNESKVFVTYDWGYGTRYADKAIKPIKVEVAGTLSGQGSDSYSMFMPIKDVEKIIEERQKYEQSRYGNHSNSQQKKKGVYNQAMVKVDNMDNVQEIQKKIKDMGFEAYSLTDQLEAMKETTKMLRFMLGAIGAVSLIVAAIGITNTMVMAIYERTREIGVMKVIGASLADIKKLFLMEAAFIGLLGGFFGVLFSFCVSKAVNVIAMQQQSNLLSSIPAWLALSALLFATIIGVASGYLPARRATKLSALTAIRTE